MHCNTVHEQRSAAVSALSDNKLRQTNSAAAVGCGEWFDQLDLWGLLPRRAFAALPLAGVIV